jgi:hypothetical protein
VDAISYLLPIFFSFFSPPILEAAATVELLGSVVASASSEEEEASLRELAAAFRSLLSVSVSVSVSLSVPVSESGLRLAPRIDWPLGLSVCESHTISHLRV